MSLEHTHEKMASVSGPFVKGSSENISMPIILHVAHGCFRGCAVVSYYSETKMNDVESSENIAKDVLINNDSG